MYNAHTIIQLFGRCPKYTIFNRLILKTEIFREGKEKTSKFEVATFGGPTNQIRIIRKNYHLNWEG